MADKALETERIYEASIDADGTLRIFQDVLREAGYNPGDSVRVVIGNQGVKIDSEPTTLAEISADFRRMMAEEGVTLDDLLAGLDEAREAAFRKTYGRPSTELDPAT